MFLQALRMTRRDWRAGELRFLLIALVVAVAALSSVGFFVDRMRSALARDAHQLLGADLSGPRRPAGRPGLADRSRQARAAHCPDHGHFPSMASSGSGEAALHPTGLGQGGHARLSAARQRKLAGTAAPTGPPRDIPAPGTVWVDENLLLAHKTQVGSQLRLGERSFRIAQLISVEPDRGAAFMNFAPRVMLAQSDLACHRPDPVRLARDLPAAGGWRAGAGKGVSSAGCEQRIPARGMRGVQIESLESGRPEMRATLDRAEQFLALVGLLSAMLAAVAVAMAARRFMLRHLDACAMLRCLGLTQSQVTRMYLIEFAAGRAGWQRARRRWSASARTSSLLAWLGSLVATDLPAPTPAAGGAGAGDRHAAAARLCACRRCCNCAMCRTTA